MILVIINSNYVTWLSLKVSIQSMQCTEWWLQQYFKFNHNNVKFDETKKDDVLRCWAMLAAHISFFLSSSSLSSCFPYVENVLYLLTDPNIFQVARKRDEVELMRRKWSTNSTKKKRTTTNSFIVSAWMQKYKAFFQAVCFFLMWMLSLDYTGPYEQKKNTPAYVTVHVYCPHMSTHRERIYGHIAKWMLIFCVGGVCVCF